MYDTRKPKRDRAIPAAHEKQAHLGLAAPVVPMPFGPALRRSFLHAMPNVRAHMGPQADASTRALGCDAFAFGSDIVFGPSPDLELAAHETAHAAFQIRGIAPRGGVGRSGDAHEQSADRIAERVASGDAVHGAVAQGAPQSGAPALQMGKKDRKKGKKGKGGKKVPSHVQERRRRDEFVGSVSNLVVRMKPGARPRVMRDSGKARPESAQERAERRRAFALARLRRSIARSARRQDAGDSSSSHPGVQQMNVAAQQYLQTPDGSNRTQSGVASGAGPVQMSVGTGGQPKVTVRNSDYGTRGRDSAPSYSSAVNTVSGIPNGPSLLNAAINTGNADVSALNGRQQRSVAALSSIPHLSEDLRVPGMGKAFRGLVRSGQNNASVFRRIPQSFPMVQSVQHGKNVALGTEPMHQDLVDAYNDGHVSDSSDDEADNEVVDDDVADVEEDDEGSDVVSDESPSEEHKRKSRDPRRDDDEDDDMGRGGFGGGLSAPLIVGQ